MKGRIIIASGIVIAALGMGMLPAWSADTSIEQRLEELEGREAIRTLMKQYGRLLDTRRFDDFGRLFAEGDGVYVTGGREVTGPQAIAEVMRGVFADNPSGLKEPQFHVFFNEVVSFESPTRATAFSQSVYVAPGEDNAPRMVIFASYDDVFVKRDGVWTFLRRTVHGEIPGAGR
jgi:uncharacterized protein (TIGR02246 family)